MRRKISAGVMMALVLLIPAAPAAARAETPGPDPACQTVERKLFKDIRTMVTIDLDTATDVEIEVLATQILSEARAESLPVLPRAMEDHLRGSADDLRAFLKKDLQNAWTVDLRISVNRTMTGAGPHVQAAAQKVLDDGTTDALLVYLNEGLYTARALDCAAQPTPTTSATPTATPSATPSATTTAAPVPTSSAGTDTSGGEGGGLPVTGSDIGTVAGVGGALLILGGAGYLIGRRRRSRFVA
ncbi:ALF repeat-containing protein [Actinoplanes sp. NPDC049548]|uniref:ALF repeat-containing protein n=1 Tax=Actinoplanes sp. NPDC049548 TaxID=3155152 RepID=UPI003445F9CB